MDGFFFLREREIVLGGQGEQVKLLACQHIPHFFGAGAEGVQVKVRPFMAAHGDQVILPDGGFQTLDVIKHCPDTCFLEALIVQLLPVEEQVLAVGVGKISGKGVLGMAADFL